MIYYNFYYLSYVIKCGLSLYIVNKNSFIIYYDKNLSNYFIIHV